MDPREVQKLNEDLERLDALQTQLREQTSDLDRKARNIVGLLNRIHSTPTEKLPELLDDVRTILTSCKTPIAGLTTLVPANEFWRWKGSWSISLQTVIFGAAATRYLTDGTLISLEDICILLETKEDLKDRFMVTTEDYLHGLISLVNELSRLAVNAVTLGNFQQPIQISIFVKDLFAGFSQLNLKNDSLRKWFDSLKYDMKKIEEVVYDISLRKLVPAPQSSV